MTELHATFDPATFWFTLLTLFSGAWTGLPPGESDPELVRILPDRVVACAAWSAAGTGQPGAPGVSGFAADPEVRLFIDAVRAELLRLQDQEDLPEAQAELRGQIERLTLKLATRPGCLYLAVGEPVVHADTAPPHLHGLLRLRIGLAVNAGPEMNAILADLRPLLRRLPGAHVPEALEEFVWNPELPGLSITARRLGDRLLLGLGPDLAAEMAIRLQGAPPPTPTRLQTALAQPGVGNPVSFAFVDLKEAVTAIPRFIGLQGQLAYNTARAVGLDGLDYALLATSVVDGRVVQHGRLATTGPLDGVLALGAGETLRPEHFAHLPADVDLLLAGSLSFSRLHTGIRSSLQKSAPFMVPLYDQMIKQGEAELGLFQTDLLQAFGDVWVVHTAPSLGGWTGNGAILSIPVREPGKARDVYARATEILEQAFDESAAEGPWRLETEAFLDHALYVFRRLDEAGAAAPCFCLSERHLYVAQHPLALKAQLRFAARPAAGPSCADRFHRERALPEGAVGLLDVDSPALVKGVWARLAELAERKALARMYAENSLFPISRIPSAAAVLPYVAPTRGVITRGQASGFALDLQNPLSSLPVLLLQAWLTTDSDWDLHMHRGLAEQAAPAVNAVFGAAAAAPAAPAEAPAKANPAAAGLLRALLPDNVEGAIPQAVFDRIAADAAKTPEQRQAERQERQRLRRERKQPVPATRP